MTNWKGHGSQQRRLNQFTVPELSEENFRNFVRTPTDRFASTNQCNCPSGQVVGRVAQSVKRLATGWTVRGSNPDGGEIFRTCPD